LFGERAQHVRVSHEPAKRRAALASTAMGGATKNPRGKSGLHGTRWRV